MIEIESEAMTVGEIKDANGPALTMLGSVAELILGAGQSVMTTVMTVAAMTEVVMIAVVAETLATQSRAGGAIAMTATEGVVGVMIRGHDPLGGPVRSY